MSVVPILAWLFTALLLFLEAVCIAASRGGIPVNHIIGVRLPPVMRTAATWRAGHAAGILPAAVAFVIALICSVIGLAAPGAYIGAIVAFVGGFVWVCIRSIGAADAVG
jgi:hypothetical protein